MSEPKKCPKCGQPMNRGFIAEKAADGVLESQWAVGKPQHSVWTGTTVRPDKTLPIAVYRCAGCGFLESYAGVEYGAA